MRKATEKSTSEDFERFRELAKKVFTTPKSDVANQVGKSKEVKINSKTAKQK